MSAVKAYLANLNGAAPDIVKLKELGVSLKKAIQICTAHHEAPAKPIAKAAEVKAPVKAIEPLPAPVKAIEPLPAAVAPRVVKSVLMPTWNLGQPLPSAPPLPEPKAPAQPDLTPLSLREPIPCGVALSLLHTLAELIDAPGRITPCQLVDVGYSNATALELCHLINCSRI